MAAKSDIPEHSEPRGPATVRDIARLAEVSIGTVDRALHNRGRVSSNTAARVWEAARELNYSPNLVARNLSKANHKLFGVLMPGPDQDSGYWEMIIGGIEAALRELAHHYISVQFLHYDRAGEPFSFADAAGRLLEARCDGVLFAPRQPKESRKFLEDLGDTPCVVFDGEVPGSDVVTVVNQDAYESGLLAGKLLHLLDPAGPHLTLTFGPTDYHLSQRRQGFVDYFRKGNGEEVPEVEATEATVAHRIAPFLGNPDRSGGSIFVTNALGFLVAQETEKRFHGKVPVIGYDLIPENARCLERGLLEFVIHQDPQRQGYSSLYALYRHALLGEPVEPRIRMPIDIVTKENLPFHLHPDSDERSPLGEDTNKYEGVYE